MIATNRKCSCLWLIVLLSPTIVLIPQGVILFLPPLPPSPLPVSEPIHSKEFTTAEIMALCRHFMQVAPSGFIALEDVQVAISTAFSSLVSC